MGNRQEMGWREGIFSLTVGENGRLPIQSPTVVMWYLRAGQRTFGHGEGVGHSDEGGCGMDLKMACMESLVMSQQRCRKDLNRAACRAQPEKNVKMSIWTSQREGMRMSARDVRTISHRRL